MKEEGGGVVSNPMQPIAGNRGGERRRCYQEQAMHAAVGIRQQGPALNMEERSEGNRGHRQIWKKDLVKLQLGEYVSLGKVFFKHFVF